MAELNELTAHELKEKILSQEISAEELVLTVFDRIDKVDDKINAYITLTKETSVKKAKEIDKRIKRSEPVGALAGIPIAVKDNICTLGIPTTCASHMLERYVPPYNATVVGRLNQQDGVVVGKTNMDEFAINPYLCEDSQRAHPRNTAILALHIIRTIFQEFLEDHLVEALPR